MSISFTAGAPTGTFLNPLPQLTRRATERDLEVGANLDTHRPGQGSSEGSAKDRDADSEVKEQRALEEFYREQRERWGQMQVNVQHHFNLDVVYQTVANRRLAFDNMTWQVPIMALTAHAFLFTIALAGDTAPLARYLSMIISIIITLLTCRLFIGHMIREVADRTWLEQFEKTYLPEVGQVHVKHWGFRKRVDKRKAGWMRPLFMLPAFQTWRDGLVILAGIAMAVIIVTAAHPDLLASDSSANRRI